jgi:uncharacterized protein YacL
VITRITRFVFMAAGLLGGWIVARIVEVPQSTGLTQRYVIFVLLILGWSIGYLLGGIVGRELDRLWKRAEEHVRDLAPSDLILGTAGMIAGLIVALITSQPLLRIQPQWLAITSALLLTLVLGTLGARVALIKRRDFAAAFPKLAPVELLPADERTLLLDTSAVIDGRFPELSKLGFLPGKLRVPVFVVAELQTLADSADDTKRARGRRGLDLLTTLSDALVEVFDVDYPETPEVDSKLMRLAEDISAGMITVDYNLTKAARVRGIEALNLNEIAAALRPSFIPGEAIRLRLAKPGKESGQGVGYLEDGTMVVVQNGRASVGEDVDVEVTSVLQTSAGRMIFARMSDSMVAV